LNASEQKADRYAIRDIREDDIEALISICREHALYERSKYEVDGKAAQLRCALFAPEPRLHAWVAEAGGELIGYATATIDFSTWSAQTFLYMDCLFVRDGWRNAGVGVALLNRVAAHACEMKIDEIQWQTPDWNMDASRFYRRCGATEILKRRFYMRPFDERAIENEMPALVRGASSTSPRWR
jgi:GNAT superfamily N-acetyltransferase